MLLILTNDGMLCCAALCRPTFDQILEELKRIKARWAASSQSSEASTACNSASPVSSSSIGDDSLQQQQQHPRYAVRCVLALPAAACRCQWEGQMCAAMGFTRTLQRHAGGNCEQTGVVHAGGLHCQPLTTCMLPVCCAAGCRLGGGQDGPGLPCIHDHSDSHLPSSDTYPPQQHDYMAHFAHGSRPVHAASAAAAGHSVSEGPAVKLHAAGGVHTRRQQQQQLFQPQQQRSSGKPPLPHMCFTDVSRDALVFLSDCDDTQDSLRP